MVESARALPVPFIVAPTEKGDGPRRISRFKPDSWILAFSKDERVRRFMDLSYGILPVLLGEDVDDSPEGIMRFAAESRLTSGETLAIVTGDTPTNNLAEAHSLRIVRLAPGRRQEERGPDDREASTPEGSTNEEGRNLTSRRSHAAAEGKVEGDGS